MTPILRGHASRLGLRKPTGVYRYRDGFTVFRDEARVVEHSMSPYWRAVLGNAYGRC